MVKIPISEKVAEPVPKAEPPSAPQNVFGSGEDAPHFCVSIIPVPPPKDLLQFYEKDKIGFKSMKLRFPAHIITDNEIDRSKPFIVSYYLADDTIQCYQIHQPNAGLDDDKQKRMVRARVKKPGTPSYLAWDPFRYYGPQDFYVGAVVHLRGHDYYLQNSDDWTFQYMEEHASEFPYSNISLIMEKMRSWLLDKVNDVKAAFERKDPKRNEFVSYYDFRQVLLDSISEKIVEHELMTVGRHYAQEDDLGQSLCLLAELTQTHLRKKNFSDFDKLELTLQHYDEKKTGCLTPLQLYITCRAYPLPIHPDLLRKFVKKLKTNNDGTVNCEYFLNLVNWKKNPLPIHQPVHYKLDEEWTGAEIVKTINRINYKPFIEDIVYGLGHHPDTL